MDDEGEVHRGTKVAPPLLEHIARQTPLYEIIKDVAVWITEQRMGAQYETNTILDPKFLIDRKTGELKYPRPVILEFIKVMGASMVFIDDIQKWKEQADAETLQASSQKFGTKLVTDPEFARMVKKHVDGGNVLTDDALEKIEQLKWRRKIAKKRRALNK